MAFELVDPNGGSDSGAIVNQWFAWEEAGRMGIGADPAMDQIENRQLMGAEAKEAANFLNIGSRGFLGWHFTADAMDICLGHASRLQQRLLCELIVTFVAIWRNTAFIYPEEMNRGPIEAGGGEIGKQEPWGMAPGESDRGDATLRDRMAQSIQDKCGALARRFLAIFRDAHQGAITGHYLESPERARKRNRRLDRVR